MLFRSAFTLEYWIYPLAFGGTANSSNYSNVLGWGDYASAGESFDFGPNSSGLVVSYYYNGSQIYNPSSKTISLNTWSHLAITGSNGTMTVYVNGVNVGSWTKTGTPAAGTYFLIGAMTNTGKFNGYLSNIRISNSIRYSAAFTPSTTPFVSDSNKIGRAHV